MKLATLLLMVIYAKGEHTSTYGGELDHYNAVQQSLITTWSYCSDWSRRLNFNLLLPIWCLFSKVSVIVAIVFGFFCFKKN
ncbi:hypothetical protein EYC80_002274 [Monilinia laxa]|uniref:LAGLIDADG endonuclease n=1 Tax=Monilinia laxa TaxID=61186 RepID=A0A5N6K3Z1_MONLA|nr:hypothetical protein EYC80_002274 [Monilinia laxa]